MSKLKIAIQKSGRLNQDSLNLLKSCGIDVNNGNDQLKVDVHNFPLEILYLRNSDIDFLFKNDVADLTYHLLILLKHKGIKFEEIEQILKERSAK